MLQFLYNWMYNHPVVATVLTVIATVIEYSIGWKFVLCFGYELCVWAKYFMHVSRNVNDLVGFTKQDWIYILLALLFVSFLLFIVFPKIFSIMDWFHSESDKPETSETREPRKKVDARVRGARGKSPGAKKEE
jgi:hypothetical protein